MNDKIQYMPLSMFLTEYKEKNIENKYKPAAVGKYGIKLREEIYNKDLSSDYSKNKLIHKDTLTIGMGSKQIDIGILTEDETYSVSPAYHTYNIHGIDPEYLDYCMKCKNQEMFERYSKKGARQGKSINLKKWITYEIPVYEDTKQKGIAAVLSKIERLRSITEKQMEYYDELAWTYYYDLFGDPVESISEKQNLSSLGKLKNGLNYNADETGITMHCLGVGDFKDRYVIKNTEKLPEIEVNAMPNEDFILQNEDIVFVRSNGNKKLVGRCVAVYPGDTITTFSGFCIRFRNENPNWLTDYLIYTLKTPSIREKMKGKGSDIQNINQKILSAIEIPMADIEKQKEFAEFLKVIRLSKKEIKANLNYIEELFAKTLSDYFEPKEEK